MEGIESEPIPITSTTKAISDIISNHGSEPEPQTDEVEDYLKERAASGYPHALFQLGHFYFEQERYNEAKIIFERIQERDYQAKYLLAVMHYDGIGIEENHVR